MSAGNQVHRDILPAPANNAPGGGGQGNGYTPPSDTGPSKPKRAQISVACEICRQRKAKCDGLRPDCSSCKSRGFTCRYSADENTTRMTTLKRKYQAMSDRNEVLEDIINLLRQRRGSEASAIVAQLQSGARLSNVIQHARSSDPTMDHARMRSQASPPTSMDDLSFAPSGESDHDRERESSSNSIRQRMRVDALLVELSLDPERPDGLPDAGDPP